MIKPAHLNVGVVYIELLQELKQFHLPHTPLYLGVCVRVRECVWGGCSCCTQYQNAHSASKVGIFWSPAGPSEG